MYESPDNRRKRKRWGDPHKPESRPKEYIGGFREPAERLIEQLDENIQKGVYSHVIGLDSSGRIPALILGGYISEVHKKNGMPPPVRLFGTPHYTETSSPQLAELFAHATELRMQGKKVLVVDDTFAGGNSMKEATRALRRHGVRFDIAIFLAVNQDSTNIEQFKEALYADAFHVGDDRVIADGGIDDFVTPVPILKNKDMNGVTRVKEYPFSEISERHAPDQDLVKESREEIAKMVAELVLRRGVASVEMGPKWVLPYFKN